MFFLELHVSLEKWNYIIAVVNSVLSVGNLYYVVCFSDYRELGMALRYVFDALKKAHDSKMFYFGIAALDRFKSRLKEFHKYCEHVASIPHFNHFPQHLIEVILFSYIIISFQTNISRPILNQYIISSCSNYFEHILNVWNHWCSTFYLYSKCNFSPEG